MSVPRVAFGVAGWSYPDWSGWVYPPELPAREQLGYLARFVDLVEINSSFYRPPAARSAESWLRQVAKFPGFFFTAKLSREITHDRRLDAGLTAGLAAGLAPLAAAGRLRHLLAQFPHDFADRPEHRDHLRRVRDRFGALANLTLELRHNSWQSPPALAFLEGLGVTVANLDYPCSRQSFNLELCRVGAERYLRLHGRNRAAWFDRRAGRDETYNYLYAPAELSGLARRAAALAASARSLTVVANNHYRGQAVANILQLKGLVTGVLPPAPPDLARRYPGLAPAGVG